MFPGVHSLTESLPEIDQDTTAESALSAESAVSAVPDAETAAWVATLRVLLNLDEFITRE